MYVKKIKKKETGVFSLVRRNTFDTFLVALFFFFFNFCLSSFPTFFPLLSPLLFSPFLFLRRFDK